MLRRYELTDEEWNRIVDLLPPENTGKQCRPCRSGIGQHKLIDIFTLREKSQPFRPEKEQNLKDIVIGGFIKKGIW